MTKSASADEVKIRALLDNARTVLTSPGYEDRLEKQLAFWALPTDRRLPLAFLPRTLHDLLSQSYDSLAATSGIGKKKMQTLVQLLGRAIRNDSNDPQTFAVESKPRLEPEIVAEGHFNPDTVSEQVWLQWRQLVQSRGLAFERVGRLCPALNDVPTVIWNTQLGFYLNYSLAEIRALKTHGEKRVRVVLEVFHSLYKMLTAVESLGGLAIRLAPSFAIEVENSLAALRSRNIPPSREEIEQVIVLPLLRQIELDCGRIVSGIARERLGVGLAAGEEIISVRVQARNLGVTRARVYQLLEECSLVMQVRWPEGRRQLDDFAQWLDEVYASAECANLLASLRELLFPLKFDAPIGEHLLKETEQPAVA
jgi:hypothetical protein